MRRATHANSWYEGDPSRLKQQLDSWLGETPDFESRAIISPHAGYRHCGDIIGASHRHLNRSSRVFVIGPSHHFPMRTAALPPPSIRSVETPFGELPLDLETIAKLRDARQFGTLSVDVDEVEHSLELQFPPIALKANLNTKIVPIMVGQTSASLESVYGQILSPFLSARENAFVISSDFCHWGSRFRFQPFDRSCDSISDSISAMDHRGMDAISTLDPLVFRSYLEQEKNTICGRHAILILLEAIKATSSSFKMNWAGYKQSSRVTTMSQSSVSYAAGFLT